MPVSEVYSALKTGVLDGQDNPPSNIWDYKFFEVQKFMTITNYATGPDPFIVDLNWYERLPADLKKTFDQVAIAAIAYSDELNRESEHGKPSLRSFADTSQVEKEADVAMILWRDKRDLGGWDYQLRIEKNRNGRTGFIRLHFDEQRMYFSEEQRSPVNV